MSIIGAVSTSRLSGNVPTSAPVDPGTPDEEDGVNIFQNSELDGTASSATGWVVNEGIGATVAFSASALASHSKVSCTCTIAGQVAAIEQTLALDVGIYTFSARVTGTPTATTPSGVFLNHVSFGDASLYGGDVRPTQIDGIDDEIFFYRFEIVTPVSLKLRIGLDQPGVIVLEQPMLDMNNGLRTYVATSYDEPVVPFTAVGIGVAYKSNGMMPRVLKYNNYSVVLCRRAPKTGVITKLGFECASNNPDDINPDGTPISRTKSMGTGNFTLPLKLTRGISPISGDGLNGRFLGLSGGVVLDDIMFRPDFDNVLATGSVTHNRGNNVGSGDRRRWQIWTLPSPVAVTAGDKLCLVGYAKTSNAANDYISFYNSPTMAPSTSSRLVGPWDLTHNRTISPREAYGVNGHCLTETGSYTATEANKRYVINPEVGQLAIYYEDGDATGMPLRENNGLPSQLAVGGTVRIRERFRHLTPTFDCRYVWLPCDWTESVGIPSGPLEVYLTDLTDDVTWSGSAEPAISGVKTVNTVRTYNKGVHTSNSFPDFTRFDLGGIRTITNGHDFSIEIRASDGSKRYSLYGGRHTVTAYDVTDSPAPPTTGLPAQYGQSNPAVLSYVERSTNTGSSWSKLSLYGSSRTDVSLSYWLQPTEETTVLDFFANPFSKDSVHHRAVGASATYGIPAGYNSSEALVTEAVPNSRGRLSIVGSYRCSTGPNFDKYKYRNGSGIATESRTIARAAGTTDPNLPVTLRMPTGVTYPTDSDNDSNVGIFDDYDTNLFNHFFGFSNTDSAAKILSKWPLNGLDYPGEDAYDRGSSASGIRWPGTVLDINDISSDNPSPIRHALNVAASRGAVAGHLHVLSPYRIWPAKYVDSGAASNQGNIPYGALGVLSSADYTTLLGAHSWTNRQRAILDCHRYYGVYFLDGNGLTTGGGDPKAVMQLRVSQGFTTELRAEIDTALTRILPYLKLLLNSRAYTSETERYSDGFCYRGGGGPIDSNSVNNALV